MGQARKSLWIEVLLAQRDVDSSDKRSADEICQQELKNAVCITLKEKGSLMKNVIRTMGYARSSTSLVEAAEKGILRPKLSRQKKNKHIRQALFSIHKSITSDTCAALLQKTCGTSANNNSVR